MKHIAIVVATFLATHLGAASPGVAWFDLMVTDLEATQEFYGALLGWKLKPQSENYSLIESNGTPIGGIDVKPGSTAGNQIAIYFEVEDTKSKLEQAKSLGASVILSPKNFPAGHGSFALFRDLEGNPIGLFSKNPVSN
jgi:predicted enzyme related to lactoylglutathione lyase